VPGERIVARIGAGPNLAEAMVANVDQACSALAASRGVELEFEQVERVK
jgi:hypothetical protein